MSYKQKFSKKTIDMLFDLGVFVQPDGSIAVSKKMPQETNEHDLDMLKFDTVYSALEFLEIELDSLLDDYVLTWRDVNDLITSLPVTHAKTEISDEMFLRNIDSLIEIASVYNDLKEVLENLKKIRHSYLMIDDSTRSLLIFYTTIIELSDHEVIVEYSRFIDINSLKENLKLANNGKKRVYASYSTYDSGYGGRGRNGPTPFGGFDMADDRVMDGREIGEGKGHATEKFKQINKFKRHPELNRWKSFGRYRTKPLRYKKYFEDRVRRNKKKKKKKNDIELKSNGLIYTEFTHDPAYIYWIDQQRNNPWGWNNRSTDSSYPSWGQYGSGQMSS